MPNPTQAGRDAAEPFRQGKGGRYDRDVERLVAAFARHRSPDTARIAALEGALRAIISGDVPRPVFYRYSDLEPTKHDRCAHDKYMYEDCGNCISDFATTALGNQP